MARGSDGESVLHKHLRVLDAFDSMRPFLSLSEIAEVAGLAPSTAHRLVGELEREGMLERMPDRSYRLGIRLWEFASRTPGALGLRELARPWLNAVHVRVRQHTQLGVLSGRDVLFVERMSTPDAVVSATLIGGRLPLAVSSVGLVLLAHADEDVVDDVIAQGWPRYTPQTVPDGAELRRRLARIRAEGYAISAGQIHLESRGIAVPIIGPHGAVYAGMGVVLPNDGSTPLPALELLRVAAARIQHDLQQAYLPDSGRSEPPPEHGLQPLLTTSRRSLEYFESLGADGHGPRPDDGRRPGGGA